ncbi:MAG: ketopantoate reductase family protein [Candidatus Promineifilaceae bacterium]|nr:ketopantoate reductase family protein [Candidatus Promineifilaceae bacterium]
MIGIIGSGALATLFAARLDGHAEVVVIGSWKPQLAALRQGLTLIHLDGRQTEHQVAVTADPAAAGPVDAALVLVKSYQTPQAVARAQAALSANGVAVTLQNGAGNLEQLQAALGRRATLGVTSLGATLERPGVVRHAGEGPIHLAPPDLAAGDPAQNAAQKAFGDLVAALRAAGFDVQLTEDVAGLVWGKLAVNAGINPLTALLAVPNGFLAEHRACRRLMEAAAREVGAVAAAQGIVLPTGDPAAAALDVARRTAANRSSMLQDRMQGRPTEIDAICGAVVAAGERHGVPTPINHLFLRWMAARSNS